MTLLKWGFVLVGVYFLFRTCTDFIDPAKVGSDTWGSWTIVESLSGSGDEKTRDYHAPNGKARIRWYVNNEGRRVGMFTVRAHHSDGSIIRMVTHVAVSGGRQNSDECYLSGARDFYLDIHSNVPWEVTIEVTPEAAAK